MERRLLLGRRETRYGAYRALATQDGAVALGLSVGASPDTPAAAAKGRPDEPNEDACLALRSGDRLLLAVADAHFGAHASHALLQALHDELRVIPAHPAALLRALASLPLRADPDAPDSAASLLVAVHRYELGAGFGFSFGDATCMLVGAQHDARPLNRHTQQFVMPGAPHSLRADLASFFEYDAPPGELLVAFTDGVDACVYGQPRRSPGRADRVALFEQTGNSPVAYVRALVEQSLAGLPDELGGQDNIAVGAART
ncbi:MAG: hypothetical protein P1V36_16365 [Planctomycetota bacterium]|nr:hypothetical protein [Planctomycetota bacterium]